MELQNIDLAALFDQLGLDSDQQSIETFIGQHPLDPDTKLVDAPFWSEQQANFLKEQFHADAEWAPVVDELNQRLHVQD